MEEIKEMDFQVITELPVVVFNVEELKSQALALVERYDGLVFTEEEIPAVRKDMAMLNTLAERLERARIDTAKQMMAPIKEFEAQIKDVSAILLKTREVLGEKVQVFVQQQKEIRRAAVLLAIEDVRAKYMEFCSALDVPLRETWLAKSTSMISVKSDINDIFAAHTKAMEAAVALAVAKNERAQAIEAKAAGLEVQYGFALPRMRFANYLSMDFSLGDAYAHMDGAYQKESVRRQEECRVEAEKRALADAARVERDRQEQARLDAEAARNRVETPAEAEIAAKQAETATTPQQHARLQQEALAPRKDGPQFLNDPEPLPEVVNDSTTMTALEALKALVQEIKGGTLLMNVKTSKAFHDAVAVIKAGGL